MFAQGEEPTEWFIQMYGYDVQNTRQWTINEPSWDMKHPDRPQDDVYIKIIFQLTETASGGKLVNAPVGGIRASFKLVKDTALERDVEEQYFREHQVYFPSGSSEQSVEIPIINDKEQENTERVYVEFVEVSSPGSRGNKLGKIDYIIRDEDIVYIQIDAADEGCGPIRTSENEGSVEICIKMLEEDTHVSYNWSLVMTHVSGLATPGNDYESGGIKILSFRGNGRGDFPTGSGIPKIVGEGHRRLCYNIPIYDDNQIEDRENFFVTMLRNGLDDDIRGFSKCKGTGDGSVRVLIEDDDYVNYGWNTGEALIVGGNDIDAGLKYSGGNQNCRIPSRLWLVVEVSGDTWALADSSMTTFTQYYNPCTDSDRAEYYEGDVSKLETLPSKSMTLPNLATISSFPHVDHPNKSSARLTFSTKILTGRVGDLTEVSSRSFQYRKPKNKRVIVTKSEPTDIEIVGGGNEGRLTILDDNGNHIGWICDDYFTDEEAEIACKQIGYEPEVAGNRVGTSRIAGTYSNRRHPFGNPNNSADNFELLLLDNLNCNGSETSLFNCANANSSGAIGPCVPWENVAVLCEGTLLDSQSQEEESQLCQTFSNQMSGSVASIEEEIIGGIISNKLTVTLDGVPEGFIADPSDSNFVCYSCYRESQYPNVQVFLDDYALNARVGDEVTWWYEEGGLCEADSRGINITLPPIVLPPVEPEPEPEPELVDLSISFPAFNDKGFAVAYLDGKKVASLKRSPGQLRLFMDPSDYDSVNGVVLNSWYAFNAKHWRHELTEQQVLDVHNQ